MRYVEAKKEGDDLRLVLLPAARDDVAELIRKHEAGELSGGDLEAEILESLLGDGWSYVEPAVVGALTSAPMISDDLELDEKTGETRPAVGGHVYAYMDYQVRLIPEELLAKGSVLMVGSKVDRADHG